MLSWACAQANPQGLDLLLSGYLMNHPSALNGIEILGAVIQANGSISLPTVRTRPWGMAFQDIGLDLASWTESRIHAHASPWQVEDLVAHTRLPLDNISSTPNLVQPGQLVLVRRDDISKMTHHQRLKAHALYLQANTWDKS